MNVSDSERIAGFLNSQGHKPAKKESDANLIILNACSVRQSAIDRLYSQIHKYSQAKKKIIIAGCILEKDKKKLASKVSQFWHPDKYFKCARDTKKDFSGYIPIMTGCNNFCSYCVVPFTRGREKSKSPKKIIDEINKLVKNGRKEITLLGQNVNSYQFIDKNSSADEASKINFPNLLGLIAKLYPTIQVKFLTSHPKDFSDELIKVIAANINISREIHLPVQSGSDKILKLMNRPYTQKKYLALIRKIRKFIPEASFTTDVIVGFPGEIQKDFQETVKVFKKVKYNEAYINKYSPRPGTAAWKLGNPISWEEKKKREKKLRYILKKSKRLT